MQTLKVSLKAYSEMMTLTYYSDNEMGGLVQLKGDSIIGIIPLPQENNSPIEIDLDFEGFSYDTLDPDCVYYGWFHSHPQGVNKPSGLDERTISNLLNLWPYVITLIGIKDGSIYSRIDTKTRIGNRTITSRELIGLSIDPRIPCVFESEKYLETIKAVIKPPKPKPTHPSISVPGILPLNQAMGFEGYETDYSTEINWEDEKLKWNGFEKYLNPDDREELGLYLKGKKGMSKIQGYYELFGDFPYDIFFPVE